jgi:uncharacterized protein YqeY
MTLREKINQEFNTALKSKNKTSVSTLRLVLSAIKDRDIANRSAKQKEEINEEEILKTLRKMKKQRLDSIEMYKKGNRADLVNVEEEEMKIIDSFLPAQLNDEETKKICKEVIDSLKVSSIKDMGKIMGSLKQKYSDKIDFSKVSVIVKGLLNS